MKANIIHEPAKLHAQPSPSSAVIAQIPEGEMVDIGTGPAGWTPTLRANGQRGFLPGETKVVGLTRAKLAQAPVEVRAEPSAGAVVTARLSQGEEFWTWDNIQEGGQVWVRVRNQAGVTGFAPGAMSIKRLPQVDRKTAGRSMLTGLGIAVVGIVITVVTLGMASKGGGMYFIAWGPAIFGGLQFLRGAGQYMSAPV